MITFTAIAKRFKAGWSMEALARSLTYGRDPQRRNYRANIHYIQYAIREVMKRQHRRPHERT